MCSLFQYVFAMVLTTLSFAFMRVDTQVPQLGDLKQPIQQVETVETDVRGSSPHPLTVQVSVEEKIDRISEIMSYEDSVSDEEIELIALITMAEAEGESELGKRLVIDTILNRVDSEVSYFPDTIEEVIYQPDQFSPVWDGRLEECYVDEEICELVREELKSRTNSEVMYFRAKYYGKYGTPLFSEGNHYFSSI